MTWGTVSLPSLPEPAQIELEFTNACNARCTACPRSDMPGKGLMSEDTLDAILDAYDEISDDFALARARKDGDRYPSVVVAGGGDPFLHPRAESMLGRIRQRGRATHVITNASRLDERRIDDLVATGLSSVSVSFWGIHRDEYESAMRLPYDKTLATVELLAERTREAGIPLCVIWVNVDQITSTPGEVAAFWTDRGIAVDLSDNYQWNRGSLLTGPLPPESRARGSYPDPTRRIWCSDLFFSDSFRWDGEGLLCCCNYFTSNPVAFGNINRDGLTVIRARKAALSRRRPVPDMCQTCVLPRRIRTEFLAEPWLPLLSEADRAELLLEGNPVR
jgi:organic radical activating enzyme